VKWRGERPGGVIAQMNWSHWVFGLGCVLLVFHAISQQAILRQLERIEAVLKGEVGENGPET
jgi:hypothetical protein